MNRSMSSQKHSWLTVLWRRWRAFGRFMGNLIARIVLTVFYFLIFAPFAIAARLFSDLLGLKPASSDLWKDRDIPAGSLDAAREQG